MPVRLSSPLSSLKDHYTVVVIGSGYGGAIAASRLARAGQSVCVLERGREIQTGEFPDTEPEVAREIQVNGPSEHVGDRTALFDFHLNPEMSVLVGCGLGGTSLINANVSLEADPRVFDDPAWPAALRADLGTLMQKGYERAREMLRPAPYPKPVSDLPKLAALARSAKALGTEVRTPPINVNFEVDGPNHVGVEQHPCNQCGDCVSGCNVGAKNTVLMNYLPDAKAHGAEIFTRVSVQRLEREGDQWIVHCQLLDSGREAFNAPTVPVRAGVVVVAAGALGSTEILLRSRQSGLSLSAALGARFSGNGDVVGFGYNTDEPIRGMGFGHRQDGELEPVGPCISGYIDLRPGRPVSEGLVVEEGSIPGAIASMLTVPLAAADKVLGKEARPSVGELLGQRAREVESLVAGPHRGAMNNTQTFLVMGDDGAGGKLELKDGRLRVQWPGALESPLFRNIGETLQKATAPLGGTYVENPMQEKWAGGSAITVHPLGGCAMGEDARSGVVNHKGQVFSGQDGTAVHPGLYVTDGSVIPRSLGLNPLLTISAISERCVALLAKDRGWTIDVALGARPLQPGTEKLGIQFTETMKGSISTRALDDYRAAEAQGQADGSPFEFVLTISTDDLDDMLSNPAHQARMVGTADAPALSPRTLAVTEGVFNLFVDDPTRVETKTMRYSMKLSADDGRTWQLDGFKLIHKDHVLPTDLWDDTTTLYVTIREGGPAGAVVAKGILHIHPDDFARQLTTLQVRNAKSAAERLAATARFGECFAGMLNAVYGGVKAPAAGTGAPRKKRPLRAPAPRLFPLRTEDGVDLRMARYQGGNKGPVLLSHGLGVSGLIFALDTVETNLVEYLTAYGYDVWNLENRASIDLPSSRGQFTLDDVARYDYPAAVEKVRAVTGAATVQVLAHCFGAETLTVSMLGGWLQNVRSAVISQISAHIRVPPITAFKSGLHVPEVLDALGVRSLTAYAGQDSTWADKLYDAALKLQPIAPGERCDSPVCHRITFMYGHLYDHAQLNEATHATLHETFGIANVHSLEHLALCARKRQVVDHTGQDVYLTHPERMGLPIAFLHGADNRCFLPESTSLTYEWLRQANGPAHYARHLVPGYGHIDCWMGKNAVNDVFPYALEHLEATR